MPQLDRGTAFARGRRLIRPAKVRLLLVALFWAALVFAFVMAILPRPPQLPGAPSDKVQHILAFTTLTALALAAYPRARPLVIGFWLVVLGAVIELVQMVPALHRDASWLDWGADALAVLLVLLMGIPVRRYVLRRLGQLS